MPRVSRNSSRLSGHRLASARPSNSRPGLRTSVVGSVPLGARTSLGTFGSTGSPRTHPRLRIGSDAASVPPFTRLLPANDLDAYRQCLNALKQRTELRVEVLGHAHGHPIERVCIPSLGPKKLNVIITAGVHGNEPCGPGAAMLLIDQLLADPQLRRGVEFTVIPMANPRAYDANIRRTPEDVDMNRVFLDDENLPEEVKVIKDSIESGTYDLALDLHSGKASRNGFWTLHRNAKSLLTPALKRFGKRWTLLSGDTKPYTMSSPGVGTSKNRSTLKDFFIERGARWSVTLEAPGSLNYPAQVLGQNDMIHEILREARGRSRVST